MTIAGAILQMSNNRHDLINIAESEAISWSKQLLLGEYIYRFKDRSSIIIRDNTAKVGLITKIFVK